MRNKQLEDILRSQAWERGHHAGEQEVENIFNGLRYDFREIDALLPFTAEPKFKVGDKVVSVRGDGSEMEITTVRLPQSQTEYVYDVFVVKNPIIQHSVYESILRKSP